MSIYFEIHVQRTFAAERVVAGRRHHASGMSRGKARQYRETGDSW